MRDRRDRRDPAGPSVCVSYEFLSRVHVVEGRNYSVAVRVSVRVGDRVALPVPVYIPQQQPNRTSESGEIWRASGVRVTKRLLVDMPPLAI